MDIRKSNKEQVQDVTGNTTPFKQRSLNRHLWQTSLVFGSSFTKSFHVHACVGIIKEVLILISQGRFNKCIMRICVKDWFISLVYIFSTFKAFISVLQTLHMIKHGQLKILRIVKLASSQNIPPVVMSITLWMHLLCVYLDDTSNLSNLVTNWLISFKIGENKRFNLMLTNSALFIISDRGRYNTSTHCYRLHVSR